MDLVGSAKKISKCLTSSLSYLDALSLPISLISVLVVVPLVLPWATTADGSEDVTPEASGTPIQETQPQGRIAEQFYAL